MRSLAFIATVMLLESAGALSFRKRQTVPVCGPCPTGADCSTWCTSTVQTVTKKSCTTCRSNPPPIPVQRRVILKPVAHVVTQPSVTAYSSKPVTCRCATPSCGPCVPPQPVVQEFQVSCSFNCITPECTPCPRAQPLQVQPAQQFVLAPSPSLPYTQKAYGFSCSITCATRGCNPCPLGVVPQIQPLTQTQLPAAPASSQSTDPSTPVVDGGVPKTA
jgi:hypothetical protein